MKAKGWVVCALVTGGVVFAMRGCLSAPPPDQALGERLDSLCSIARDNLKSPARGVRKLGSYLGKHTGDMLGEFGQTLEAIESISDDGKHDKRAMIARDRIRKPMAACEGVWMEFSDAVDGDPEATALLERFATRLNRTFEIFLSGTPGDTAAGGSLRALPARLEHALDSLR